MYILLDISRPSDLPRLLEATDFTSFKVVLAGAADPAAAAASLARIGRPAGDDHVYIEVERLREIALAMGLGEEWLRGFKGMVDYARRHGWTDDSGAVRAHIEVR